MIDSNGQSDALIIHVTDTDKGRAKAQTYRLRIRKKKAARAMERGAPNVRR